MEGYITFQIMNDLEPETRSVIETPITADFQPIKRRAKGRFDIETDLSGSDIRDLLHELLAALTATTKLDS